MIEAFFFFFCYSFNGLLIGIKARKDRSNNQACCCLKYFITVMFMPNYLCFSGEWPLLSKKRTEANRTEV